MGHSVGAVNILCEGGFSLSSSPEARRADSEISNAHQVHTVGPCGNCA